MIDPLGAVTPNADPALAQTAVPRLLQVLGVAFGLAVMIGNTIGMGILRTPGEVAAQLPSAPMYMLAWVAGATYALLGALCVAELGAMHPRSGGLYPLVRHGLGGYLGFVSGWTDWVATCCSIAAVAMVFGEYLGPLWPAMAGSETSTGSALVLAFALLQWRGIRLGDAVQQMTSLIKAVSLIALAVGVFVLGNTTASVATAVTPSAVLPSGLALAVAVIVALQSVIFTYDGWTGPVYFGEEVRDPGRNIPRAMIGGVLLVLAIYLALNLAFLHAMPIEDMAGDPFVAATVATRTFGPNGDPTLRVLMLISLIASVSAMMLMATRIPYAMARDRLLPALFAKVNAGGTPTPGLAATTALALVFIASNTFDSVLALMAFFFVANYVLAFSALFALRRREPKVPRPFRVPGYPWVPAIVLLGSVAFLIAAIAGDREHSLKALALLASSAPAWWIVRRLARA